jgi:hypothetical protein
MYWCIILALINSYNNNPLLKPKMGYVLMHYIGFIKICILDTCN